MHNAIRDRGGIGVMGDHQNSLSVGLVEASQHVEHSLGVLRVEITRRLIRQEYFGLTNHRARYGYPLLLASGERKGAMMELGANAEHLHHPLESVGVKAVALNVLGDGNIVSRRQGGQQIEALQTLMVMVMSVSRELELGTFEQLLVDLCSRLKS